MSVKLRFEKCPATGKDVVITSNDSEKMVITAPDACLDPDKKFELCKTSCPYASRVPLYTMYYRLSPYLGEESLEKIFSKENVKKLVRARNMAELIQLIVELDIPEIKDKIKNIDINKELANIPREIRDKVEKENPAWKAAKEKDGWYDVPLGMVLGAVAGFVCGACCGGVGAVPGIYIGMVEGGVIGYCY